VRLVIQIPGYNEAEQIADSITALPRAVPGFDDVRILVIDDGSTDGTTDAARAAGAHHVLRLNGNRGLAAAFMAGLKWCLENGADVIVNTDADNQYCADDVAALVAPIVQNRADIVVGARPIDAIKHFSPLKRRLQRLGSYVARSLSGTEIEDAPSGFRAMTADAAARLNVFNRYTYTLETIIQAGRTNLRLVNVPVRVNPPTRPSRLIRSTGQYVRRSAVSMLNTYLIYRPARVLGLLSLVFLVPAAVLVVRYLVLAFAGAGKGHVHSVIASGVLGICGVFALAIGVVAHLLAINRRLIEEVRYLARTRQRGGNDPRILERKARPVEGLRHPREARGPRVTDAEVGVASPTGAS